VFSEVSLSDGLQKAIKRGRIPKDVVRRLRAWIEAVGLLGLREVRCRPGYHDEPLRGVRKGQRSIRLGRKWRAIYTERFVNKSDGQKMIRMELITVEEVTPHDY